MYELWSVLNEEYEVFAECLERLTRRQRFLTYNDRDAFGKDQAELRLLARKAADLESQRISIIEIISGGLKLGPGDNTVNGLLERLKAPEFRRFERLKKTIVEAYERAERQKERSDSLIRQSLDIIEKTVDCDSHTYEQKGRERMVPRSRKCAAGNNGLPVGKPIFAEATPMSESGRSGLRVQ